MPRLGMGLLLDGPLEKEWKEVWGGVGKILNDAGYSQEDSPFSSVNAGKYSINYFVRSLKKKKSLR